MENLLPLLQPQVPTIRMYSLQSGMALIQAFSYIVTWELQHDRYLYNA